MYAIRSYYACLEIAKRSRGTPRVTNRLLRRARDFAEQADLQSAAARTATGAEARVITSYSIHYTKLYEVVFKAVVACFRRFLHAIAANGGSQRQRSCCSFPRAWRLCMSALV